MTNEQFENLVHTLEIQARQAPVAYQSKVLLLALLGNLYLGAILLLLVALLLGLLASVVLLKVLALKLLLAVGVFLSLLLKALVVKIKPPTGIEIKPKQAPELFQMIADLRRRLGAPRFHHVLVTADFNAGVALVPRLGIFGWNRNYLLIGLPLLKSLTVEQFKAVLAHEFGHLAKGHGRLSNWIYRQRLRWSRLMAVLEANQSMGSFLFKPFLNWYAPYFNAYSFPLARANEYEADATSVRLTSPRATAEALTNVSVIDSYFGERYWPQIHKQADEQPQPHYAPYFDMGHGIGAGLDDASAQAWLDQAMGQPTNLADTHPALGDRLKAIGEPPRLATPALGQAADTLLGEALEGIAASFDRQWKDDILPSWEARYHEVQAGRVRLGELDMRAAEGAELSLQEAFDRAKLTGSIADKPDDALAQLQALHQRVPDDAFVCFTLAARLLERDDETGCQLAERALQLDETATLHVCELLRDYHWRRGREQEAHAWHQRLLEGARVQNASDKERNQITKSDIFLPHGLAGEALAEFRVQLQAIPGLCEAYFVKKQVEHFAHRPCYVLGFSVTGLLRLHSESRAKAVLQKLQEAAGFPGETILININGDNAHFKRKFKKVSGSRVV